MSRGEASHGIEARGSVDRCSPDLDAGTVAARERNTASVLHPINAAADPSEVIHSGRVLPKTGTQLRNDSEVPPILADKHHNSPSAFTPESLLREARRQKKRGSLPVPDICLLDPDGDIVRQVRAEGRARRHDGWVCYHTDLYVFEQDGLTIGAVGCAVGSSFAVLVAEELFASGCKLLVSVTSSGQLVPIQPPPYFVMIDRALRDEGTSYHYLPPAPFSDAPEAVSRALEGAFDGLDVPVLRGSTWTTDAPFRETDEAISAMRRRGLLAVEMEAAALYAFAAARRKPVVCFAHVTNLMGQIEGDFEKGDSNGTISALMVVVTAARRLQSSL